MRFSVVEDIEKRLYYYMCGYALCACVSTALSNICLGLATAAFLHRLLRKHDDLPTLWKFNRLFVGAIVAFQVAVLLSCLLTGDGFQGIKSWLNACVYRLMPFFVVWYCIRSKRRLRCLAYLLLISVLLNNWATLGQVYMAHEKHLDLWRLSGFVPVMPHASILAVTIPLLCIGWLHFKRRRVVIGFLLITAIVTLLFNGTRGAWLSAMITLMLVLWLGACRRKIIIGVSAVLFLGLVPVFVVPQIGDRLVSITDMNDRSKQERLYLWESSLAMWRDNPLVGIGFGRFPDEYKTHYILPGAKEPDLTHAHNNLVHILAECGVIGVATFVFLWVYIFWWGLKKWRGEKSLYGLAVICTVLAVNLHGLSEYNLGAAMTAKFTWLVLGLCLKAYALETCKKEKT